MNITKYFYNKYPDGNMDACLNCGVPVSLNELADEYAAYSNSVKGGVWMINDINTGMIMGLFKDHSKAINFISGSNNMSITNIDVDI